MSNQKYSPEFKDEGVKQVPDRGHPVEEVAANLGIPTHDIYKWVKETRPGPDRRRDEELLEAKREVLCLSAELRRTREKRDVLKNAAAYFARGSGASLLKLGLF